VSGQAPKVTHVFEGQIWVRPMYRGVEVTAKDGSEMHFDDWVAEALGIPSYTGQGGAQVRLTLEVLSETGR
jgi:hypothetical protein